MSTFVAEQDDGWLDDGWTAPEPFELDGIMYDPVEEIFYEAFDRPSMFEVRTDECHCSEHLLQSPWTCSGDAYRYMPGEADMPPLRFGGAA